MTSYRSLWLVPLGCLLAGLSGGCGVKGGGPLKSESRQIEAAQAINVCCGFEVRVTQGKKPSAEVTTDSDLLGDVVVETRDGTLFMEWQDNLAVRLPSHGVKVELVLPELASVTASGGSKVTVAEISGDSSELNLSGASTLTVDPDGLSAETVRAEVSGGSSLQLGDATTTTFSANLSGGSHGTIGNLSSTALHIEASGASVLEAAGITDDLELDASGASALTLDELAVRRAQLNLSGGSSASVDAREKLEIVASGGSQVTYRKEPPEFSADLTGGSTAEVATPPKK